MLGRVVQLQLEHVDGVGHPHHHVRAASGAFHLRADVNVEHGEYQIYRVLIESLGCCSICELLLESLNVGYPGHIGLHLPHGQVNVALLQCFPKLSGESHLHICFVEASIDGEQAFHIADPDFLVGNRQGVGFQFLVIVLDGQVTALVEQWQSILHVLRRLVECRGRHHQSVE